MQRSQRQPRTPPRRKQGRNGPKAVPPLFQARRLLDVQLPGALAAGLLGQRQFQHAVRAARGKSGAFPQSHVDHCPAIRIAYSPGFLGGLFNPQSSAMSLSIPSALIFAKNPSRLLNLEMNLLPASSK